MSAAHHPHPRPRTTRRPRRFRGGSIVLGHSVATGKPYTLAPADLTRGVHLLGAIGAGKTSLLRRLILARDPRLPWVQHDYIGTGHRHLETMVALEGLILAAAEAYCPERAGSAARHLGRHAFLRIGDRDPAVRFDLLRRRRLPDGSRESVRDVTGRALQVLFTKLNDADDALRVRFRRIATALLACLVGAERPITEALRMLDDGSYIGFIERELHARMFSPSDRAFLKHQLGELHHVLMLRPTDPAKSWRAFEDMTESTRNSLADFAPGTLLGELFGAETVPLAAIAFGGGCLSVTTRHPDETLKSQAFQAIHAMLHTLFLHRPSFAAARPLLYVVDEPWWVRRHFPRVLAVSRNLGVSYAVSHQHALQWEEIALPTLARGMRALTNLQITFRPTLIEDAEAELLHARIFRPDGMVQRFTTKGSSSGAFDSSTHTDGWSAARVLRDAGGIDRTDGTSGGEGWASGDSWQESEQEVLSVVGFRDQLAYAAQAALRRPRFTGTVVLDGIGTEVAFAPTPEVPPVVDGIPILDLYRRWHDRHWRARLMERTPYDPTVSLLPRDAVPVDDRHTAVEGSSATNPADHAWTDGQTVAEPADHPHAKPVPPPTFEMRPSAPSRGRRRRRRGGKRDA